MIRNEVSLCLRRKRQKRPFLRTINMTLTLFSFSFSKLFFDFVGLNCKSLSELS